jgi:hypothetical protein
MFFSWCLGQFLLLMFMALLRKRKEKDDERQDDEIEPISSIQTWVFSGTPYVISGFCFLLSMTRRPNIMNLGYLVRILLSLFSKRNACFYRTRTSLTFLFPLACVDVVTVAFVLFSKRFETGWCQASHPCWFLCNRCASFAAHVPNAMGPDA